MQELNECLNLAREIKEKRELLAEMQYRSISPKNQILSGMPRGGGAQLNQIERNLIQSEKLKKAIRALEHERLETWKCATFRLKKAGVTNDEHIKLLEMRFFYGFSWKKCNAIVTNLFPNSKWDINKCFRVYRASLRKVNIKTC